MQRVRSGYQTGCGGGFFHTRTAVKNTRCRDTGTAPQPEATVLRPGADPVRRGAAPAGIARNRNIGPG